MNERIRELAEHCDFYVGNEHYDKPREEQQRLFMEKFAELIVAECMELASKEQKRYASITHRNMSECAVALGNFSLLMKDHFGVEE